MTLDNANTGNFIVKRHEDIFSYPLHFRIQTDPAIYPSDSLGVGDLTLHVPKMYFIALDSPDADAKTFRNVNDTKDAETIRKRFKEKKKPEFLFKDGNEDEKVSVGTDLEPGVIYVWFTKKAAWEDEEMRQNALVCSQAVYTDNPFQFLKKNNHLHGVNELVAVGDYKTDEHGFLEDFVGKL